MKHAYLIIAHGEWDLLRVLVGMLDDPRNDIFIHIDKKVGFIPEVSANISDVYVYSQIETFWGDVSQIQTELFLFAEAHKVQSYDYYHLLSGTDLPLKSNDYIDAFFEEHAGKEFIDIYPANQAELIRKAQIWHFFPHHFRDSVGFINSVYRGLRSISVRTQLLLGIRRNRDKTLYKGANWVSITNGFVEHILEKEDMFLRDYSHTFCADEIFLQTECMASSFRECLFDFGAKEYNGALRYVDWQDGAAVKVLTDSDYGQLMATQCLFARKFSSSNMGIVKRIQGSI